MKSVYPFTTEEKVELSQVGGKGLSLIFMTRHDLPVPPGFVLTVAFFQLWLDALQQTPEWTAVRQTTPESRKQDCDALKAIALRLELDDRQKAALAGAVAALQSDGETPLLAVRSSSPEEDLEGASFAGGYETSLGVTEAALETAVRHSFASCLDERVFVYKQEHGFPVDQPRIAVIVHQQIASDVSGVAFSLNPLNNCYDEAIINANFGLGESVVAGMVSPDTFVVDKVNRAILEKHIGAKETAVWLNSEGETYQKPALERNRLCLSDGQVLALTDLVSQIETIYDKPLDIEWAYAGGQLYLLQARPITAYFPLPPALRTPPGQPKLLYADLTQSKWGMHEPLTVLGTDYLKIINIKGLQLMLSKDTSAEAVEQMRTTHDGRTYIILSNSIKFQGKKRVIAEFREMDTAAADILEALDDSVYLPEKLPPGFKGLLFKALRNNLGVIWQSLQAIRHPVAIKQKYLDAEAGIWKMRENMPINIKPLSIDAFPGEITDALINCMRIFTPLFAAAIYARYRMKRVFKNDSPEVRALLTALEQALPNNITIAMGLAMYQLASYPEIRDCESGAAFVARLEVREFSPKFLAAWDEFIAKYGFRCPMEMDVGVPRMYERPSQLFAQLRTLADNNDPQQNPQAIFERAQAQREQAYAALLKLAEKKSRRRARQFTKHYRTWIELGGFRESPKYLLILITDMFRRPLLEIASTLVENGRLDNKQQLFDLHLNEVERALSDPSLDLRSLAEENTRFLQKLRRVRAMPRIVDSRGKIFRPPPRVNDAGDLVGQAISPGVVQGPVKVLHRPDEKPVLPGDILITRATDPGWTPLFLNASGVILEVGGMLQHGALVAREYGKPCVAGIVDATSRFRDEQMVELNGTTGVVRLI